LGCKADGGGEAGLSNYGSFHILRFIVSYLTFSMSGNFQLLSKRAFFGP
jgi:hypothetical protein